MMKSFFNFDVNKNALWSDKQNKQKLEHFWFQQQ